MYYSKVFSIVDIKFPKTYSIILHKATITKSVNDNSYC